MDSKFIVPMIQYNFVDMNSDDKEVVLLEERSVFKYNTKYFLTQNPGKLFILTHVNCVDCFHENNVDKFNGVVTEKFGSFHVIKK